MKISELDCEDGVVVDGQLVRTPPPIFQLRVPVRVPAPPKTVAVKVIGVPTVVVPDGEAVRRTDGDAERRLIGKIAEVALR